MRILSVLLALALAPVVQAEETPATPTVAPTYEITASGDLEIGPDGRVHHYELDHKQPAPIEAALAKGIAQWRFVPVLVEGRPVIAVTRMRMRIAAEPIGSGGYQLRVRNVWFGEPSRSERDRNPPSYPLGALHAGMGAKVLLVLKLDEHGKVARVHTEQVSLDHRTRSKRAAKRWREMFADASTQAARRWKFDINEIVNGEPVGTSVRVPVGFYIGGRATNSWNSYLPGPRHPIPWVTDEALAATGGMALEDGEVQPLNSRFRLSTKVVGTLL